MLRVPASRALVLAGVCGLAVAPFLWWGIPSGHDFEFHMGSWMEVLGQWRLGIIYPRWAAGVHFGYGEARFLFYPPASWTLGAALGAVLPWTVVPAAYCWIALTLAGAAMHLLAREWLTPRDAMFAAAFYAVNPYHLLIVYWRSAYAELLSASLLPLMVLCLLRLRTATTADATGRRAVPGRLGFEVKSADTRWMLGLSVLLAAAWLTNAPAAVMIHYSTAGLACVLAVDEFARRRREVGEVRRSVGRFLLGVGAAILLGAGLAAFYLIPAIYEQRWISMNQVLAPGVRPQDNFLFTTLADADHNRFNDLLSTVAVVEIGALLFAIFRARRGASAAQDKRLWLALSAWGAGSALLTVSMSGFFWKYLPKFRFVQLPFRWLLCLNAALAVLLTMAAGRWMRTVVCGILLAVLIAAGLHFQHPWWDDANDVREMAEAVADGKGYEGTDEYVPTGADAYELDKSLSPLSDETGAPVPSQVLRWDPLDRHFLIYAAQAEDVTVRLFNYPAWEVLVNGERVEAQSSDVTGLIVISLDAGNNDVRIRFRRTRDRVVGDFVSLVSLLLVFVLAARSGRGKTRRGLVKVLVATSNAGKLRDFSGAAAAYGISVDNIPAFASLPPVIEDGLTFEENARKKAEAYSLAAPGELVLADDSGLEVDAIDGAPGVHSARFAMLDLRDPALHATAGNADDGANNARLLLELVDVPPEKRIGRFVCVLAAARDGKSLRVFRGTVEGVILGSPRGDHGFGYDPLFFFPGIQKTFGELDAEEKARYSHRGAAFREFLLWCSSLTSSSAQTDNG